MMSGCGTDTKDCSQLRSLYLVMVTGIVGFFGSVGCHLFRENFNTSVLAAFFVGGQLCILAVIDSIFLIKYLQSVFWCVACLMGVFVCENADVFLNEIDESAHYVGSFPLAAAFFSVLWIFLYIWDKLLASRLWQGPVGLRGTRKLIGQGLVWVLLVVGVVLLASVITKPSFLLGIDRFAYDEILPASIKKIRNVFQVAAVPIVMIPLLNAEEIRPRMILWLLIALLPLLLFFLWVGNKFGVFFFLFVNTVCIAVAVWAIKKRDRVKEIITRFVRWCTGVFLLMLFVLSLQYASYEGETPGEMLFQRMAQQGQLWWSVFDQEQGEGWHWDELVDETIPLMQKFETPLEIPPFGVYKLMALTTSASKCDAKIETGARYSAQAFELPYYYLKLSGLALMVLVGSIAFPVFLNMLIRSLLYARFLESLLVLKLYLTFIEAFNQGVWHRIVSLASLSMIAIVFTIEIYYAKRKKFTR